MDPTKSMIVIHPGMTGHTLNWSSRNYGRLIQELNQKVLTNLILSFLSLLAMKNFSKDSEVTLRLTP